MKSFFDKHLAVILSALVSIAGWVWTAAISFSKANDTAFHMEELRKEGSELARQDRWRIEVLEKDVAKLEGRVSSAVADIAQIKSDVRVVAEWVQEQKRRHYEGSSVSTNELYQQVN